MLDASYRESNSVVACIVDEMFRITSPDPQTLREQIIALTFKNVFGDSVLENLANKKPHVLTEFLQNNDIPVSDKSNILATNIKINNHGSQEIISVGAFLDRLENSESAEQFSAAAFPDVESERDPSPPPAYDELPPLYTPREPTNTLPMPTPTPTPTPRARPNLSKTCSLS